MGLDPDRVEARARERDAVVLSGTADKPHGLRECHVADPRGFRLGAGRRVALSGYPCKMATPSRKTCERSSGALKILQIWR